MAWDCDLLAAPPSVTRWHRSSPPKLPLAVSIILRFDGNPSATTKGTDMEIRASGSAPSRRAPDDYFTGTVWQDPVIDAPAPGNVRATLVHFEPGARTVWHTHPAGQTLYILSGVGRVQSL